MALAAPLFRVPFATAQSPPPNQRRPIDVLPETTAIYLEIADPATLVDRAMSHPLRAQIEQLDDVQRAMRRPQFLAAKMGLAFVETQLGKNWQEIIHAVAGKGLYVGVDAATKGVVVLLHAEDEEFLSRAAGTVLNLANQDAKNKKHPEPFQLGEYRGHKTADYSGGVIARVDDWLVVSNQRPLAQQVVDRLIDGGEHSLADAAAFAARYETRRSSDAAWAFVDLNVLRQAGVAPQLYRGQTDDPGVELLFGGILDVISKAPHATAALTIVDGDVALDVTAPLEHTALDPHREFFFGQDAVGQAPAPLLPGNLVANVVSYRDIAGWWLSKEDLFEENVIARLAQADSQLSTIFGGVDFGKEVLGALEPGIQIVATRQPHEHQPDVVLPAFAAVARLSDPDQSQRRFRIAFQSLVAFVNIDAGSKGLPQLDVETIAGQHSTITTATYAVDESATKGLIQYNFSPTLVFHDHYMIVSSTRELGEELAALAAASTATSDGPNTRLTIDAGALRDVLRDNRQALITNHMLEQGSDQKEAESQIDAVLALMGFVERLNVELAYEADELRLAARLELAEAQPRDP